MSNKGSKWRINLPFLFTKATKRQQLFLHQIAWIQPSFDIKFCKIWSFVIASIVICKWSHYGQLWKWLSHHKSPQLTLGLTDIISKKSSTIQESKMTFVFVGSFTVLRLLSFDVSVYIVYNWVSPASLRYGQTGYLINCCLSISVKIGRSWVWVYLGSEHFISSFWHF